MAPRRVSRKKLKQENQPKERKKVNRVSYKNNFSLMIPPIWIKNLARSALERLKVKLTNGDGNPIKIISQTGILKTKEFLHATVADDASRLKRYSNRSLIKMDHFNRLKESKYFI